MPSGLYYKCFGCGESGDVFTWFQRTEGLNFPEALEKCADIAGVRLTKVRGRSREEFERMLGVLSSAKEYFQQHLEAASGYLVNRGVTDETCKRWELGYAPLSWSGLRDHLLSKGFTIEELASQSLVSLKRTAREGSKNPDDYFDYFKNRFMFPIYSHTGKLVGFGGRAIDDEADDIKFLNSRDGPLFRKKEVLFGINHATKGIRETGKVLVTEGYQDVISAHQAGMTNVVGTCGTALTKEQAAMLKRYSHNVVLVMDGDNAGINAGKKATSVLFSEGLNPRMCLLPGGMDLDDVVMDLESPVYEEGGLKEMSIVDFHLKAYEIEYDGAKPSADDNLKILTDIIDSLKGERDITRKMLWIHETAQSLGIPQRIIEERYYQRLDDLRHSSLRSAMSNSSAAAGFVASLLGTPDEYRKQFYDIPPESSFFTAGVREVYRIIRENGETVQLRFPLRSKQSQGNFLTDSTLQEAFDFIKGKFDSGELTHFPYEIMDLFLNRRFSVHPDVFARFLRFRLNTEKRDRLIHEMFSAGCENREDDLEKIEGELERILQNGR